MAETKQKIVVKSPKPTPKEAGKTTNLKDIDRTIYEIMKLFKKLTNANQIKALEEMGVGSKFYTCQHCGKIKTRDKFYVSTALGQVSGITDGCKQCAEEIAIPTINGEKQQPTKETVDDAMYFLDKPMLDSIWEASLLEAANSALGKTKNNVYTAYCKNVQLPNYYTYTYRNSDNYTGGILSLEDMEYNELSKDQEIIDQFEKNKKDTLRLLGYLPFEKEKLTDQPFLYSQLIGFLDSSEEGNDDMMRVSSIISIVRSFLQLNNIDDMIASLSADPRNAEKNISTIRALQQMKSQVTQGATKLAEQSCISLKNNKHSTHSANTWTGKLKACEDLDLREYEINGYDLETCKGMRQVADISMAAILKSLQLDESEYSDMLASQTKKIYELEQQKNGYEEAARILLKENIDLRDLLSANKISINDDCINLNNIVNNYFIVSNTNDS